MSLTLTFRSDPSRRRVSYPADEATDHSAINTLASALSVADMCQFRSADVRADGQSSHAFCILKSRLFDSHHRVRCRTD